MRYYVLAGNTASVIRRHIIAEVVRDVGEDVLQREESFAGLFAGPNISILTIEELLDLPDGPAVLRAWDTGNDTTFYLEEAWLERESARISRRHLRVVPDEGEPDIQNLDREAYLIKRAAYLQLHSAELVARAKRLQALTEGRNKKAGVGAASDIARTAGDAGPKQGEAI